MKDAVPSTDCCLTLSFSALPFGLRLMLGSSHVGVPVCLLLDATRVSAFALRLALVLGSGCVGMPLCLLLDASKCNGNARLFKERVGNRVSTDQSCVNGP